MHTAIYHPVKQEPRYCPKTLAHGGKTFILNSGLECLVSSDGGYCIIYNDLLDITVWGASRTEAEQAFAFSFDALHRNYAEEKDQDLTDDAIALKRLLNNIIKTVLHGEAS